MSRRPLPPPRILDQPKRLGCGCFGQPGQEIRQARRGGRWYCLDHLPARVRDFPPRRGPATVAEILAAEARRPEPAPTQTTRPGQAGAG